jgi:AraC-like DNA-binding protein
MIHQAHEFSFLAHYHDEIELYFVIEGCQIIGINNQHLSLGPGQIGLVAPWHIHYYERCEPVDGFIMVVSPDLLDRRLSLQSGRITVMPDSQELAGLINLFRQLLSETSLLLPYYELAACGLLRQIFARLLRPSADLTFYAVEPDRRSVARTMQDILGYLEQHYQEPLDRSSLADRFRISPAHFSRTFKSATGLPWLEYLTRLRVAHARRALETSGQSVTEIALASGFDSIRTFNRCFYRLTGCSPSACRSRQKVGQPLSVNLGG